VRINVGPLQVGGGKNHDFILLANVVWRRSGYNYSVHTVHFSIEEQLLYINVQRFRGGLVFKADRLFNHTSLQVGGGKNHDFILLANVVEALGLAAADQTGTSDPFVKVEKSTYKTVMAHIRQSSAHIRQSYGTYKTVIWP